MDLTINGSPETVRSGELLIEVINRDDVKVPPVCYHPQLGPIQTCDTCMVEVDGKLVRACATRAAEGMSVNTSSPRADAAHREALDRILGNHLLYCAVCDNEAPLEHAEALLDLYKVLKQVHDHGIFELLRGALSASDKLIKATVDGAKSDESVRAIRNAIILGKILGSIHPDVLRSVDVAVSETLECHEQSTIEPRGIFSLLSQFRGKELRQSIALVFNCLTTLASQLNLRRSCD